MATDPKAATDGILATALVTTPAWGAWLGDLNQLLTSLTLIVGLALGVGRLITFFRDRAKQ